MISLVILSGCTGSGKTTSSRLIQEIFDCNCIGIGDLIRNFLDTEGRKYTDKVDAGKVFIKEYGTPTIYQLLNNSLSEENVNIIDGLRYIDIFRWISEIADKHCLIHIDTDDGVRRNRLINSTDKINESNIEDYLSRVGLFDSEMSIWKTEADAIIVNNGSVFDLKRNIFDILKANKFI